ncbi:MAG: glycine--tRNA ligase [Bacteroidales bacterium]|nr:glycine--tRNA ligase [Bacteroidales bacterium]
MSDSPKNQDLLKSIIAHAKEYGFIFPSSEIYDGLSAIYDYGPYGIELKNNIRSYWWKSMVQLHENIVGLDAAIFMHPQVWKASGHVDAFNDPMIDNKDSKKRYRADELIEDYIQKLLDKANKEVEKARKKFGDDFNEEWFKQTNSNYLKYVSQAQDVQERLNKLLHANDLKGLKSLIDELEIVDPISGSRNWTEVRQFNLMFETLMGPTADEADKVYLRPETAQGIFVNFLNVQKTARMKIPFGIAQVGKAFRNEIVARQFIFRMREFEQMEMQFFVRPGEELEWFEYWKEERMKWHLAMGIPAEKYRWHVHEKLAHYANAAVDIEFEFPFGFKEIEGIHSRTNFDLSQHQLYSGKKMTYFDPETGESYIPYVIETSIGLDRTVLAILSHAYCEENLPDGSERTVLRIPSFLAPIKIAILPLVKKDGMPEFAYKIYQNLKHHFMCFYEEKDTIGRRYRRQDAIGTPYCVTIDNQTLDDSTVTIRNRDTMEQIRIHADQLLNYFTEHLKPKT